jgi:ComF family protein
MDQRNEPEILFPTDMDSGLGSIDQASTSAHVQYSDRPMTVPLLDRLSGFVQRFSVTAIDFLVPHRCCLCGRTDRPPVSAGVSFCVSCAEELSPDPVNRCERCGAEAGPHASTQNGCTHCRNRKLRFRSVICLSMYEGRLRKVLLSAKWSFSTVPIRSLARLFVSARKDELQSLGVNRIIPIPQHWRQRLVRNFNPAAVIAEELGHLLRIPCDVHVLQRARRTRPQKRVSVHQRFENQQGALTLRDSHMIQGERILLVDDVLTTGATCSEAAALLRHAGAAECHVAVIGRVLDHSA